MSHSQSEGIMNCTKYILHESSFCINLTKNLKFCTVRDEEKQFSQFNFSQDVIYQFGAVAWPGTMTARQTELA